MNTASLLHNFTADGAGPSVKLMSAGRDEAIVQVNIPGTATVMIQGRVDEDMPWITLQQVTTSQLIPIARVAQIRASVSGISGGAVNAKVQF